VRPNNPPKGGAILTRLETTSVSCFVFLAAIFNRFGVSIRIGYWTPQICGASELWGRKASRAGATALRRGPFDAPLEAQGRQGRREPHVRARAPVALYRFALFYARTFCTVTLSCDPGVPANVVTLLVLSKRFQLNRIGHSTEIFKTAFKISRIWSATIESGGRLGAMCTCDHLAVDLESEVTWRRAEVRAWFIVFAE